MPWLKGFGRLKMIYIEHFLAAWFERRREQSGDAGVNANGDITSMYPKAQKEANLEVIIEEQARPVTLLAYPRPQLV